MKTPGVDKTIDSNDADSIEAIYRVYQQYNPEEAGNFPLLEQQILEQDDAELRNRSNFMGHVTVAVFILDKKNQRVLLLEHKALKRFLQPGGHLEAFDESPFAAALREMKEETGITASDVVYRQAVPGKDLIPFDIDTHYIPSNSKKPEPEHYHHDFRYLFISDGNIAVHIDDAESNEYQWVEWAEFIKQDGFKKVARKIEELSFRKSASHFFDSVFSARSAVGLSDTYCVAVEHILPSTYKFIIYLNNIFEGRLTVLAKPKSIDHSVKDKLTELGITIQVAQRDTAHLEDIVKRVGEKQNVVLLDIGGYFAELATKKYLPVIGIVEDTENGHQKYHEVAQKLQYPVISVARSELKKNEDALVGQAIVHATDSILRHENRLIDYMDCVVIGYGKIGAGIVKELQNKGIKPVVVEKNPVRAIDAIRNGAYLRELNDAIGHTKVIFCATGNKALTKDTFQHIRSGAFLVSVTSSDDEFDLDYVNNTYEEKKTNDYLTKHSNERNYFYLVNKGNAVNFLFNAALDRYIYLVQAELLVGVVELLSKTYKEKKIHFASGQEFEEAIASQWIKEFTN